MIKLIVLLILMFLFCLVLITLFAAISSRLEIREAKKRHDKDFDPVMLRPRAIEPKAPEVPGVYSLDDVLKTLPEELRRDFN